jgi:RecB family exonuclease
MSKPLIALSWSRLSQYRQCPTQFEAKYISKSYPDEGDNPAFAKGTRVHKQLEDYINFKKGILTVEPKPGKIASSVLPIIDMYFNKFSKDSIFAEQQLALDHNWNDTEWFGKPDQVKFRGIVDMVIFESTTQCTVIDFKTGKYRKYEEDFGQLHMTASFLFELYQDIQDIKTVYLFAEHKKKIVVSFNRSEHSAIKAKFNVEYLQVNEDEEFLPTKNKYCFFCAIKEDCIYG